MRFSILGVLFSLVGGVIVSDGVLRDSLAAETSVAGHELHAKASSEVAASAEATAGSDDATVRTTRKLPTPVPPVVPEKSADPLRPLLKTALECYRYVRRDIDDYTCVMVRRERIRGRLRPHEFIYAKVRHRRVDGNQVVVPFSIYLKFLKPKSVAGREVLYVEGENNGEMFARRGGTRFAFVTTRLDPFGELAMRGNRYPVTEFGIENLLYRLVHSARDDLGQSCAVDYLQDARINERPALGIIVTQQSPAASPEVYQSRIFIDRATRLPIHYEAYDWPTKEESPELIEKYTYMNVQLNVGLNDADFSADNPQYRVK